MFKRKDTELIVESWKKFIKEDLEKELSQIDLRYIEMYKREYSLVSRTQRREGAPSARPETSMQIIVAIKNRSPAPRIAQYKFKRLKK